MRKLTKRALKYLFAIYLKVLLQIFFLTEKKMVQKFYISSKILKRNAEMNKTSL